MASSNRTSTDSLDEFFTALQNAPYAFHFFQVLRRLECHYRHLLRLGKATRLSDDPVRLAQEPSLAFAPATLAAFTPGDDAGHPSRLSVYFLGLFGPQGPLPLHLTEYAYERKRGYNDPTFSRFADIFHHRILSLFYRAWADTQPTVNFDRPETARFNVYVGAVFGLGMPSLWNRDAVPDLAKFHYAGRLSAPTRNSDGLEALLSDFFHLPMHIENFVGHWLPIDRSSQCRLGETPETGLLGLTAIVGERIWDCQYKFRIVVGPMDWANFQRFLPGQMGLRRLVAWVRNYLGDELIWDVHLILKKEEVPPLTLGGGSQLGWTTWLASRPPTHDADDVYLDAVACCEYRLTPS